MAAPRFSWPACPAGFCSAQDMPVDARADAWWKQGTENVGTTLCPEPLGVKLCGNRLVVWTRNPGRGPAFRGLGEDPLAVQVFFDGHQWSSLPSPPDFIDDVCIHPEGGLLVFGFRLPTRDQNEGTRCISRWTGVHWLEHQIATDDSPLQAWSLTHDTILRFHPADPPPLLDTPTPPAPGTETGGFWRWNGAGWTPWNVALSDNLFPRICLIERHDGSRVLGGKFTAINDIACRNIAIEADGHWSTLGDGLPYAVMDLCEDDQGGIMPAAWRLPMRCAGTVSDGPGRHGCCPDGPSAIRYHWVLKPLIKNPLAVAQSCSLSTTTRNWLEHRTRLVRVQHGASRRAAMSVTPLRWRWANLRMDASS